MALTQPEASAVAAPGDSESTDNLHWYPVACGQDLELRHVAEVELGGVEIALWRDDDGCVNAWENRCCHRSARLSVGVNMGRRLRCAYHGWQYRSGDGRCVVLPAASQSPPPLSVRANVFAVVEYGGFVWVNMHASAPTPTADMSSWLMDGISEVGTNQPLRSFVLGVDAAGIVSRLAEYVNYDSRFDAGAEVRYGPCAVSLAATSVSAAARLVFLVQPARRRKIVVHSVLVAAGDMSPEQSTEWRKRHFEAMGRLRQQLIREGAVVAVPRADDGFVPAPRRPVLARKPSEQLLPARVTAVRETAQGIWALELEPTQAADVGALADFLPGAHVDLRTPAGMVRQYSIVSRPGAINPGSNRDIPGITLGIKREPKSRGGSESLCTRVSVGDVLNVSRPKNHFRLVSGRGALLLAGGIGMTPLLSMARYLCDASTPCALHYFVRSDRHVAFPDQLERLRGHTLHVALTPEQTGDAIRQVLTEMETDHEVYVCGPRPFLDAVLAAADNAGVERERVHFELFSNTVSRSNDRPFRVRLARSGTELEVPADRSLVDVLIEHGCAVETSCEQGVCGTCRVRVLEGQPDHRDAYLNPEERQRFMQACVSRSLSDTLVVDL